MDPETIILSEVSQTEKGKYHMIPFTSGILKKGYSLTHQKQT